MMLDTFLTDIYNFLQFISMFEVIAYFLQILYLVARMQVNTIWYHVLGLIHPLRAFLGLYIARMIPTLSELI